MAHDLQDLSSPTRDWTLGHSSENLEFLLLGHLIWSEVKSLSHVQFFETPWTVAYQAPQSMEFSRQEYWSGLPLPSPGDLPNPGIKPRSPTLQADALPLEPRGKPGNSYIVVFSRKIFGMRCETVFWTLFFLKWLASFPQYYLHFNPNFLQWFEVTTLSYTKFLFNFEFVSGLSILFLQFDYKFGKDALLVWI